MSAGFNEWQLEPGHVCRTYAEELACGQCKGDGEWFNPARGRVEPCDTCDRKGFFIICERCLASYPGPRWRGAPPAWISE